MQELDEGFMQRYCDDMKKVRDLNAHMFKEKVKKEMGLLGRLDDAIEKGLSDKE